MIITCEECSTRFNLDDSLVRDDGSKVRCSVCKHIFTVFPLPLEGDPVEGDPEPAAASPDIVPPETDSFEPKPFESDSPLSESPADTVEDDLFEAPAEFEMEDSDYSLEDTDLGIETPLPVTGPESDIEPAGLDIDGDMEVGLEEEFSFDEGELETADADEGFSLADEESDLSLELDHSPDTDDTPLDFGDDGLDDDIGLDDQGDTGDMEIELEEDFSFDEGELEIADNDAPFSPTDEEPDLSLELDDSPDDGGTTLDFDDAGSEELDGIEFEPLDEDVSAELPDVDSEAPELELELAPDDDSGPDDDGPVMEETDFSSEDDFELEFDVSDDDASETGREDDAPELVLEAETDTGKDEPEPDLSVEEQADEDEPPMMTPEEDFGEYDAVLEQETEPDIETPEPDEPIAGVDAPQADEPPPPDLPRPESLPGERRRRKKKKPLIGTPVLILILIFLLVAGAYIASLMTGYHIPYISDVKIPILEQVFKKPVKEAAQAKPIPNKSVNGRFVTNTTAGTLFVITGSVDTPSDASYSHIEIKGTLFIKDKVAAKTKTAFCGNIISEDTLKTGNITDINKQLAVRQGRHNANVNVKPGTSVPFMIVFSDLPEKLQNFTVAVTRFDRSQS